MNSLFKALPLILLLAGALLGQGTLVDCTPATQTFTSATTGTAISNANTVTPCRSWEVSYDAPATLSALSIQFETSPDNSSWTAVPNNICSSSQQPPCVIDGANPSTTTGNQTFSVAAYGRFVRVNVTTYTGSGTLTVRIFGYKGLSAKSRGGGSGGSGPTTNQNLREVAFAYSGGGLAIVVTSPISWCRSVTAAGTIKGIYIEGDLSGNATVDIRTQSHASAISTGPSTASSIMGPSVPTFSGTFGYTDETLTGVTTTLAAKTSMCTFLTASGTITSLSVVVAYAAN